MPALPLQPLDAVTLSHLAREWNDSLSGAKVNKIQQATHTDLLFQLWSPKSNTTHRFLIDIRPQLAFACILPVSPAMTFPKTPLQLCVLLRKYLTGARLRQVKALPAERVVIFDFDNYNEFAEAARYAVVIELMGKHSNIVLVDSRVNIILATAHGVSDEMSRHRSLRIGDPYMPPPRLGNKPLLQHASLADWQLALNAVSALDVPLEDLTEALMQHFSGVGRATVQDILEASSPDSSPSTLWQNAQRLVKGQGLCPHLTPDGAAYRLLPGSREASTFDSVNALAAAYYWPRAQEAQLSGRKQSLQKRLQLTLEKMERRLGVLAEYLADDAAEAKSEADDKLMLLAEKQFDATADDTDWLNVQKGYSRYKKLKQRQTLAQEEQALLTMRLRVCDEIAFWLSSAATPEDMAMVEELVASLDWLRSRHDKTTAKTSLASQPKRIQLVPGIRLWVGKSALQNDWLIKHAARPGDQWYHVQYGPGAHVIVQAESGFSDTEALKMANDVAAQLAVHFSSQRLGENVAVVTADSRHVKRVAAGPKGLVQFKQEESVFVTIDEEAIADALELLTQAKGGATEA